MEDEFTLVLKKSTIQSVKRGWMCDHCAAHTHTHSKSITLCVFLMALYKQRGETKSLSVVINKTAQMWSRDTASKITPNLP